MKSNNIKFIYLAVGLFLTLPAGAKAASFSPETKTLDRSVSDLVSAKDDIGPEEKLSPEEELNYRKKVVDNALSLSLKEASTLRGKIEGISLSDENEIKTRKEILADLDDLEAHYKGSQKLAEKADKIEKIKELAVTERDYREKKHSVIVSRSLDFILVFQAESLVKNSSIRYEKISSDLKKLERANLISAGKFSEEMEEARKFIENAKSLMVKAKSLIIIAKKEDPVEKEALDEKAEISPLSVENILIEKEPAEEVKEKEISSPTPRELSEAALTNLKSGYDSFIKISASVRKTLGVR